MYGLPSETILVISSEDGQGKGPSPWDTVFAKHSSDFAKNFYIFLKFLYELYSYYMLHFNEGWLRHQKL
jgi:hypothetical protein